MISVVIRSDGHPGKLVGTLAPLVSGAAAGVIRDVAILSARPSGIVEGIADQTGARIAPSLKQALEEARSPWILSIEAGTRLEPGWEDGARDFIEASARGGKAIALFRLRSDRKGLSVRLRDRAAGLLLRVSGRLDRSPAFLTHRDVLKPEGAARRAVVQLDAVALRISAT